ncbi:MULTISPECIES: glutaredoxin family protein [Anoxybacillus]|jgi:glutaredoxin-like YruB-family protein|uniref:Glutaredoxin-like protein, YruB-family n=2 Tax=Anoxybacillus TaxID=150247 RepID=A0A1I0TW12_9BACL|nr:MULTISPECIES: glutaredoxin family protein [Anoxybacillus]QAV25934.1 glutaredoxin family protein [Neobacillus thermocopriae]EMT44904.1 glutaredoxin [Anoxybacillus flavithermus AK1]MBW7650915.1 glutaredoxin family protein [Anoxybacillus sp. ST4]NNU89686.1 glutaredoxin family protein [Anoxybacillus sp. CHMUD]SFA55116.1 Glutaredoxin-like protein, YruB-family [Anoxybacillus pushchinoensis]
MKQVTVYTTTTCPYCTLLKNFLVERGIPFKEVNLHQHPEAVDYVVRSTGQMGVPQTEINGRWVIGFDPQRIMQLLQQ